MRKKNKILVIFLVSVLLLAGLTCAEHLRPSEHCGGDFMPQGLVLCSGAGIFHDLVLKNALFVAGLSLLLLAWALAGFRVGGRDRMRNWDFLTQRRRLALPRFQLLLEELFAKGILKPQIYFT